MIELDKRVLYNLTLGVYGVGCNDGQKLCGCIANSIMQVTANPESVLVSLNYDNYTTSVLEKTKLFSISIFSENVDPSTIGTLGFKTSKNINKFDELDYELVDGLPVVKGANSYLICEVVDQFRTTTHMLFLAKVIGGQILNNEHVMTYEYYHKVRKGIAPKTAPTYIESSNIKVEKENTVSKEISKEENNMKYKCLVCGQIIDTNEKCPVCGAEAEKIVPYVEEELTWADEHHVGVAQGVDEFVLSGLRDHFKGECSEVGMYLAMARQAFREGYPEVGMVLEQIAKEEAEHAAKFAEMLGELVSNSTKANLEKMLAGENGACKSKKEIATRAKQLNYDAIHDSVHEMTKDEARHGKALEALLKRYF